MWGATVYLGGTNKSQGGFIKLPQCRAEKVEWIEEQRGTLRRHHHDLPIPKHDSKALHHLSLFLAVFLLTDLFGSFIRCPLPNTAVTCLHTSCLSSSLPPDVCIYCPIRTDSFYFLTPLAFPLLGSGRIANDVTPGTRRLQSGIGPEGTLTWSAASARRYCC